MLQNQILDIKKQNLQYQQEIEELEQYARILCLIRFEGIPAEKNITVLSQSFRKDYGDLPRIRRKDS